MASRRKRSMNWIVDKLKDTDDYKVAELDTHSPPECVTEYCDIHDQQHPDDPLKDASLNWRADADKMEHTCEHGIGHPTYAQQKYWETVLEPDMVDVYMLHSCDGCCYFQQ